MKRNLKIDGIIIRNYRIQDYHKGAVIFSPQAGILHAVAYGGYKGKSKLGPSIQSLNRGIFDIYQDPVKKSSKIIEYEPQRVYENVKNDLNKYFTALLWLEIAIKTHGGGEGCRELYQLMSDSLDLLDMEQTLTGDRLMIQFLLRSIVLFGGSMAADECGTCGREPASDETVYYDLSAGSFVCGRCASPGMPKIPPGIRKYIEYSFQNDMITALNAGIENNLLKYLKSLLYSIIQEYLEDSLSTLQTGKDYLV